MISAAINDLKERGRSSRQAIQNDIIGNYNARLKAELKAGMKAGNFKQSKGRGAAASFRLGQTSKKSKTKKIADDKEAEDGGTPKSCTLEADLNRQYYMCQMNPPNIPVIPSAEFNVNNVPLSCQDADLASCIRSVSDLTVRVTAIYVSERRPPTEAVSGKPYPDYLFRGRRRIRVGIGWLHSVLMCPDKYNSQCQTCPCQDCCKSSTPMRQFAFITIYTKTHLVFNDLEGKHCICHLFFHGTPETCKDVVTLTRMWRVFSDTFTDRCLMIHVTHDMNLATRLEKIVSHHDFLKESFINKCLLSCPPSEAQAEQNSLQFLVPHPHGSSSNISLDVEKGSEVNEEGVTIYTHNIPACPGPRGDKVIINWNHWKIWGLEHTHSGAYNQGKQVNYSSHGVGSLPPIRRQPGSEGADNPPGKSEEIQEQRGPAEVEECSPETDLHEDVKCEKNPGHKNFTPMHQFSEDHLPPDHRHLVEHIKALGKIVALVSLKEVSDDRPQTFPGSTTPYPRTPHRGTAWVFKVVRFSERNGMGMCTCEECQDSSDPKTEFALIIMHTAAHVVLNESERKQTTCYLFYDEGRTLEHCADVVRLSGMSHVWSDVEKDICKMLYVTHDPDVIYRVEKAVNEWESAQKSLELMNKIKSMSLQESTSADGSHQPLAIIVSHPHGCSKQVSIGRCVSTDNKGYGHTVCTYTTPTCRGCSGAYVYVVGREYQSWDNSIYLEKQEITEIPNP